jgi:selenocysteine-specific elongation factor
MATLGTAGHVDHGKSALVRALTGIDPDRLAEEQARGMTIDLGFAWLTLPDGREISIVDVPGHEDFIKNMLAGVGGIDLALLVVAADEGVMPQTREHLAILDLLRVPRGIVALTKSDLVDADWLALVREEVAALLAPTTLAGAPLVPVSALTGAGLPELVTGIMAALPEDSPEAKPDGVPRLPLDRVFTIKGFGTIVTGTLLDGPLRVGQEIALLPTNLRGRVRGLQQHKTQVPLAWPGTRVALNLAGIDRQALARGMVVTQPDVLSPSTMLDVRLTCWSGAPRAIKHNALLDLAIGAAETGARVRLLEGTALLPGESGWAQLRLTDPVAVARGDRFIVRNPSPSETLGGGSVADPVARHQRRRDPALAERLTALLGSDPAAILLVTLTSARGQDRLMRMADLAVRARLTTAALPDILADVVARGAIERVGIWYIAAEHWTALVAESQKALAAYHTQWPLRVGMPREEWRARLGLTPPQAEAALGRLITEGHLMVTEMATGPHQVAMLALPDHQPAFTPAQQDQRETIIARLQAEPLNPPAVAELTTDGEVLAALLAEGRVVRLSDDLVVDASAFAQARDTIIAYLRAHERVTVAAARDLLGATRRIIVPLLETLDAQQMTRRVGDARMLGLRLLDRATATPPPAAPETATE